MSKPQPTTLNTHHPRHIGIIMDGNGRWAQRRGLPRSAGHLAGSQALTRIYQACSERGIQYLTTYAFSTDNWSRPAGEVTALMQLFASYARERKADLVARSIHFATIGDLSAVPGATRDSLEQTKAATHHCGRMQLTMAINYGGRQELLSAMRAIAGRACDGALSPGEIELCTLRHFMSSARLPDVDLLIRAGGEKRLSDFLLYESAYAELYFSDVLWPDYTSQDLDAAIRHFSRRERRYGGLSKAAPGTAAIAS